MFVRPTNNSHDMATELNEELGDKIVVENANEAEDDNLNWKIFYSNTTLHGFRYLFEQSGVRKLGWLAVFLASSFLAGFLFIGVIRDFQDSSTISAWNEKFSHNPLQFPTLTFCNLNSIAKQANVSKEELDMYEKIFLKPEQLSVKNSTAELKKLMTSLKVKTVLELHQKFEIGLEEMITDELAVLASGDYGTCRYRQQTCNQSSFVSFMSSENSFGRCYQFNHYEAGKEGLRMDSVDQYFTLFLNVHSEKVSIGTFPTNGIVLFIHPYGTPFTFYEATKIPLSTGKLNFVFINKQQWNLVPYPFENGCREKSLHHVVNNRFPYTKEFCMLDCIAGKLIETVGCVGVDYANLIDEDKICTVDQYSRLIHAESNYLSRYRRECEDSCPKQCLFVRYASKNSGTVLKTNLTHNQNHTQEYVSHNLLGMMVSFEKLSVSLTEVHPAVTWKTMLGSLGGNLGLCLGFSILTLCEFLFFGVNKALQLFYIRREQNERKRKAEVHL